MDHLLRPKHASYNPKLFEIQCYANTTFAGHDFDAYPEQCGWTARSAEEWSKLVDTRSEDLQGFLQSWLYFGTLHTFLECGTPLDIGTFGDPSGDSNGHVLDTSPLPTLFQNWLDSRWNYSREEVDECNKRCTSYAGEAQRVHRDLRAVDGPLLPSLVSLTLREYLKQRPSGHDPREPLMAEAQAALFDMINAVKYRLLESKIGLADSVAVSFDQSAYEGGFLWTLMVDRGWCPADLSMVFNSFSLCGIVFASFLEIPNKDHRVARLSAIHQSPDKAASRKYPIICSTQQCAFYQQDRNSYETLHVEDCEGCPEMRVDDNHLLDILGQGVFPLVKEIDENWSSTTIPLRKHEDHLDYVAICHIWADGLGNGKCNGMPRCQMLRLSERCRKVLPQTTKALFWIDTLCIPSDKLKRLKEQQTAMELMRRTYAEAHTVLVLENWLLKQSLCSVTPLEALLKVVCSQWTRRLWTLQEGALAQRLRIASSDGYLDPDTAYISVKEDPQLVESLIIRSDIIRRWRSIRGFTELQIVDRFYRLYPALAFRANGDVTDEALCLGILFDVPVGDIWEERTHEDRMRVFWSKFTKIPPDVKDTLQARLKVPGFRWAPLSFLRDNRDDVYSVRRSRELFKPAIRTPRGLEFCASGYSFDILNIPVVDPIFVRHHSGVWGMCELVFDNNKAAIRASKGDKTRRVAMISHAALDLLLDWSNDDPSGLKTAMGCAAFVVGTEKGGGLLLRRFGVFTLERVSRVPPELLAWESRCAEADELDCRSLAAVGNVNATSLQEYQADQAWILD